MKNMKKKAILMLAAMALLLTVTVGSTIAYLWEQTASVENKFEPAKVASEVKEDFDKVTKSNVCIKNTGNIKAMIRATIVVTWQDKNGHTMASVPEDAAYKMELNLTEGWSKHDDGFYYWNEPVAPGETTGVLIKSCTQTGGVGKYKLCVEVIGSAIQAEGGAGWGTKPGTAQ